MRESGTLVAFLLAGYFRSLPPDSKRHTVVQRRHDIAAKLRQRLVSELHLGLRRPGDRMQSTRDLAREFGADHRVVLAAYRELEQDGLVEFRPRSGVYVTEAALAGGASLPRLAAWALEVFVEGLARGVPAPELPERLRRCLETLRLHATCIECNHDQLHSLCQELHRDYGLDTTPIEIDELESGNDAARRQLGRTDLLVTTPFHAAEVKRIAERAGKPWFAIALASDLSEEMTRLLQQGPVYVVATDTRFRDKVRAIFAQVPNNDNMHVVITGEDDLDAIPANAPTYVMKSARDVLGALPKLAHLRPMDRVFSKESARELLRFILRANVAAMASQTGDGGDTATSQRS